MSPASTLPVELWTRIFSLACTDDGRTGRSLSLVSTYFHEVSLPLQLQSVEVAGYTELSRFADKLERTSPNINIRRVHHLCISHSIPLHRRHTLRLEMMDYEELLEAYVLHQFVPSQAAELQKRVLLDGDWQARAQECLKRIKLMFATSASRVLQAVAPHVRTLALQIGAHAPFDLLDGIRFEFLSELTVHGVSFRYSGEVSSTPTLQEFPSLRYLHLVVCGVYLPVFAGIVPKLTHLRVSGTMLSQEADPGFFRLIHGALSSSSESDHPASESTKLLSHVHQVVIEPSRYIVGLRPTFNARSIEAIDQLMQVDSSRKLVALNVPSRHGGYGWAEAKEDWIARLNGGEGCWKKQYDPADVYRQPAGTKFVL